MRYLLLLTTLVFTLQAKQLHKEKHYQKIWCDKYKGYMEHRLKDATRIDCVTRDLAVEFDFAKKWHEAIGQALYYGIKTNKQPTVALILEKKKDFKHLTKLKTVAKRYGIRVVVIDNTNNDYE
jgi:hypothetical protein